MMIGEHILALILTGHDVGFNACLNIYPIYGVKTTYRVEIHSPLDENGVYKEPWSVNCKDAPTERDGEYLKQEFESAVDAVAMYCKIYEWLVTFDDKHTDRRYNIESLVEKHGWKMYGDKTTHTPQPATKCPKCGFFYAYDGTQCKHCNYKAK